MITIIEKHYPEQKHFRIKCGKCTSIFECDASDCMHIPAGQGFWVYAIKCPVCHHICADRQGDDCEWYNDP